MYKAFIVTGDRYATPEGWAEQILTSLDYKYQSDGKVVCIHGNARGIDTLAKRWCENHLVDTIPMPYIRSLGYAGGPVRNTAMLKVLCALRDVGYEIVVHAFHDSLETSKGTKDMVNQAKAANVPVLLHPSNGPDVWL